MTEKISITTPQGTTATEATVTIDHGVHFFTVPTDVLEGAESVRDIKISYNGKVFQAVRHSGKHTKDYKHGIEKDEVVLKAKYESEHSSIF